MLLPFLWGLSAISGVGINNLRKAENEKDSRI